MKIRNCYLKVTWVGSPKLSEINSDLVLRSYLYFSYMIFHFFTVSFEYS